MKALRFEKTGSLEELKIQDVPQPIPGPGFLLVAVKAAGLNPSDAKNVLGRMHQTKAPRIPGRDFAGIVAVGTDAYPIGSEVFGSGGRLGFTHDGSHAEYIEVPAEAVQPKPRGWTFEQAASVGIPYLTAWHAIIDVGGKRPGLGGSIVFLPIQGRIEITSDPGKSLSHRLLAWRSLTLIDAEKGSRLRR